jgi:hypothetical protein
MGNEIQRIKIFNRSKLMFRRTEFESHDRERVFITHQSTSSSYRKPASAATSREGCGGTVSDKS